MIRVLHILDHSLPMHSGYTFRTRAILKAQQALGCDVHAITGVRHTAGGPDVEQADGLVFARTRAPAKSARTLPGLAEWHEVGLLQKTIARVVTSWRPDIIHAHSPALCGLAAARAAKAAGLPLVYEIRAFWEDAAVGNGTGREGSLKYRMTRALENHVVKRADAVVTICEGLRDDLIGRGHDPALLSIMPNGVDLAMFGTPAHRDNALARELGFTIRRDGAEVPCPVIGFIGSFYDYEGLDVLIDAMPALLAQQGDARLLLVGDGPCAEALRAQAAASPAAHAIQFVGRVDHHEVERYYALCDIMVYPRKKSRLTDLVTPLKPLEAMAQGKIVAASDVGGHRELIRHNHTGVLFAPDDPLACAQNLAMVLDRRQDWDTMRAQGRHHVETRHDWSINAARYLTVYQTIRTTASHQESRPTNSV